MKHIAPLLAGLGLALSSILLAGCEETGAVQSITLTPASADITAANGSVVFTAVQATNRVYIAPLEWSVSDPSRGTITSSGGASAVYKRNGTAKGGNAVIVRDQTNAEGVAAVNQL